MIWAIPTIGLIAFGWVIRGEWNSGLKYKRVVSLIVTIALIYAICEMTPILIP